jgi:cytochrome c-type biogenesis protein CcmF
MTGNIAIYIGFFTALAAGVLFFLHARGRVNLEKSAVNAYYVHAAAVLAASAYLLHALLAHKFQYFYVYAHTDLSLSTEYLISAFWAGQEGSYLFWALCAALIGLVLLKSEPKIRSLLMPLFMAGQAFLLLFLMLESPFHLLDPVPLDGGGINPMLLDPWMMIHPPVVFIGYALLLVPFVYAAAALYKKEYHQIFINALPWAAAGWFFLGAGIFIGGAWAYRVLGWGGYWGWDPVENASLVPWLTASALVHGMLLQKQKRYFMRTNIFLALTTFLLVVFATFLTRSGVMAEYSVHAFADTALTYYLAAFMLSFALAGYGLFAARYRGISAGGDLEVPLLSRQGSFGMAIVVLCVSAVLVLLGTLSPLLTGLLGKPASVDETFYVRTNAPLAALLVLLLGFGPFLKFKKHTAQEIFSAVKWPLAAVPAAIVIALLAGVKSLFGLLFIGAAALALATNTVFFVRCWAKSGIKHSGGYLAHVGLALMFIGIFGSTAYSRSHKVHLYQDQPLKVFGYTFTYTGHAPEGDKYALDILVESENKTFTVRPKMFLRWFRGEEKLMIEPAISRGIWRDLYVAPESLSLEEHSERFVLARGQSKTIEGYTILFKEFTFPQPHTGEEEEEGIVEIGAVLEVTWQGQTETVIPVFRHTPAGNELIGAKLPGGETEIKIDAIDASRGEARFVLGGDCCPGVELLVAELKLKPLISVLAFGTTLLIAGTALAVWRRFTVRH